MPSRTSTHTTIDREPYKESAVFESLYVIALGGPYRGREGSGPKFKSGNDTLDPKGVRRNNTRTTECSRTQTDSHAEEREIALATTWICAR